MVKKTPKPWNHAEEINQMGPRGFGLLTPNLLKAHPILPANPALDRAVMAGRGMLPPVIFFASNKKGKKSARLCRGFDLCFTK